MVVINNSVNNTTGASNSGATNTFTVTNPSNTASSKANIVVTVGGSSADDATHQSVVSGVTTWTWGVDNSASDAFVVSASSSLGTTDVMQVQTTGQINFPLQPAFLAFLGTTDSNVTGDATVFTIGSGNALTEVYDKGNNFVTTGTFTAPVTGYYNLGVSVLVSGATSFTGSQTKIVTSNREYRYNGTLVGPTLTAITGEAHTLADMDVGDTATFVVSTSDTGGKVDDVIGGASPYLTWVYGYLQS